MKNNIIKCPNCGWEYLPGEIYLPKHFLGQPKEIERTIDGKILLHYGTDPDLNEIFRCEHCGKTFEIAAEMSFTTKTSVEHNFDDDYVQPLYGDRISLQEE